MRGKTAFFAFFPGLLLVPAWVLSIPRSSAAQAPPAGRGEVEVQVLDQAEGKLVPGAWVYFLDQGDEKTIRKVLEKFGVDSGRAVELFREFGTARLAGPKGKTTIPGPGAKGIMVAAEHKGKWGAAYLSPGSRGPLGIRIGKVSVLEAQVVDQAGRPREWVPVAFQARLKKGGGNGHPAFLCSLTRGPKGIARFQIFPGHPLFPGPEEALEARLSLWIPLKQPVARVFPLDAPPPGPVRLVLPPTGSVLVVVKDAKRPASPPDCSVTLDRSGFFITATSKGAPKPWPKIPPTLPARDGKAFFPYVGLGLNLEARAFRLPILPGRAPEEAQPAEGLGPAVPGASVTFQVAFAKGVAWFSGRLLDPSGKPLAKGRFECEAGDGTGTFILIQKFVEFETDEKGEFRFRIEGIGDQARSWSLWIDPVPAKKDWRLRITPAGGVTPGEHKLGDLRFQKIERVLLASGRVVDEKGAPLEGAQVQGRGDGLVSSGPPARTGPKGEFAIYGEKQGSTLRLTAKKEGYFPKGPCQVPLGTKGVVLVLQQGGSLAGSLLADPGFPVEKIRIDSVWKREDLPPLRPLPRREWGPKKNPPPLYIWEFFGEDTGLFHYPDRFLLSIEPGKDGSFKWKSLPRGKTEIQFFFPGYSEPFLEIPEVEILPGKENRDPRLQKIDLRGKIGFLELDLADESGRPVKNARIFMGSEYGDSVSIRPGRKIYFYKDRYRKKDVAFQAFIRARGYRQVRIPLVSGKKKLVLKKGIPIEIVYEGNRLIPPPPTEMGFYLNHLPGGKELETHLALESTPRAVLGPDKKAKVRVPCPGEYALSWFKESPGMNLFFGKTLYIQVEDRPGQVFHIKDE